MEWHWLRSFLFFLNGRRKATLKGELSIGNVYVSLFKASWETAEDIKLESSEETTLNKELCDDEILDNKELFDPFGKR